MKAKTIITATLLLFVAASVLYLVIKETGGKTQGTILTPDMTEANKIVVYYFHGNVRCVTCRTIEAYAKEAIQTGFVDELNDGRLEWRVVNIEDPGNEHFVQDFQLSTRSVVLERIANGKRQEWKNLERVWELVRGDKEDFLKYIQNGTTAYLAAEE